MRRLIISTLFLLLAGLFIAAQERRTNDPAKAKSKIDTEPRFGNCETNSFVLDHVRDEALKEEDRDRVLIAIARLGEGETTRELNKRRLYTVESYLKVRGLRSQMLITAQGAQSRGNGRIEFYIAGKLFDTLIAEPCKDLPVGNCMESFYVGPYYLPRRGRSRWCH